MGVWTACSHLLVARRILVESSTIRTRKRCDGRYFVCSKLEIADRKILNLTLGSRGLRERDRANLNLPSENDLRDRAPVSLGNFLSYGSWEIRLARPSGLQDLVTMPCASSKASGFALGSRDAIRPG